MERIIYKFAETAFEKKRKKSNPIFRKSHSLLHQKSNYYNLISFSYFHLFLFFSVARRTYQTITGTTF